MIATEMPAAISPYSIAVAPFSSRRKDFNIVISASPEFSFATYGSAFAAEPRFHSYPKGLKRL